MVAPTPIDGARFAWSRFGSRRAQNALLLAATMMLGMNLVFSGTGPRQAEAQVGGAKKDEPSRGVRGVSESTTGINPAAQRNQMLGSLRSIESRLGMIESRLGGEIKVRVTNPAPKGGGS